MNEPRRQPPSTNRDRRRRQRNGSLHWPFWLGLFLLVTATAWFLVNLGRDGGDGGLELSLATGDTSVDQPAGDRAVVLVFPEWDATGYVTERRRVASRGRPEEDLFALLGQLCDGPTVSGAISALPRRTKVLAAFLDATGHHAVVDFSTELVVRHPGGSAAEAATLTSILRTVALNFPDVRTCRILIDGAEAETLGGHLSLAGPYDLRRWL